MGNDKSLPCGSFSMESLRRSLTFSIAYGYNLETCMRKLWRRGLEDNVFPMEDNDEDNVIPLENNEDSEGIGSEEDDLNISSDEESHEDHEGPPVESKNDMIPKEPWIWRLK